MTIGNTRAYLVLAQPNRSKRRAGVVVSASIRSISDKLAIHGAGKTTVVNHLLAHAEGRRIAAVVNDFGAINIDAELIAGASDGVVSLANGCICSRWRAICCARSRRSCGATRARRPS